jgi:uncharacterized repeat protein (TIGR01451 family)
VVDQLAGEYAGQPVLFLEQDVDASLGKREDLWWAAKGGGTVSLPLSMVDSGNQIDNGYTGFENNYNTYKAMVDTALARPALAEIEALGERVGNKVHFTVQLENLSGVELSFSNSAMVHAIVYEEHTPLDPDTDHITGRIVRAAVWESISPALPHGETRTFELETADLSNVVNWDNVHTLVLADYRPGGSNAHDMLQAALADPKPALSVHKWATPGAVSPGELLTYTLHVANTGNVPLNVTITDTLPQHVAYAGPLVWTTTLSATGDTWEHTFAVTVEAGYDGVLVNRAQAASEDGATDECFAVTNGYRLYLPTLIAGSDQ